MRFIPTILQLFRVPSDHFQPLGSDRSASGAPAARLARHFRVIENMLRPLLVIGALLLSAVLATMASQRQLTFVLIAILALAALAVLLRWPPLGLIFTAVAGLVVPFYGPSGLNVTTVLVAVLLTLWLIGMMVHHRELRLATSRTNWPLLTFMTVALLSFGFGQFS